MRCYPILNHDWMPCSTVSYSRKPKKKKENKHTQLEGISKSKERFSLVTYIHAAAVLFVFVLYDSIIS